MKIDFGCGHRTKRGFIGVDCDPNSPADVHYAGRVLPFKDNSVDEVWSNHVLEHVENIWETMSELHRICRDGAKIELCLPHWSSQAITGILTISGRLV